MQTLIPGQRKSIQNQRVSLAWGEPDQVTAVQRIFREFGESLISTPRGRDILRRD